MDALTKVSQPLQNKLATINSLRLQQARSQNPAEQSAYGVLIDLRIQEVQPLLNAYTNGVATFLAIPHSTSTPS